MSTYLKTILAFLLFFCLLEMSDDYYQLVRFVAMLAFAYFGYLAHQKKKTNVVFMYIGLAILFQPFVKILLSKTAWEVIDVLVGLGLLVSLLPATSDHQAIDTYNFEKNNNLKEPLDSYETRALTDFVVRIDNTKEKTAPTANQSKSSTIEVEVIESITVKISRKTLKEKPNTHLKNKWLYPSDNLGKLERGVEFESKVYLRENFDKDSDDFTII